MAVSERSSVCLHIAVCLNTAKHSCSTDELSSYHLSALTLLQHNTLSLYSGHRAEHPFLPKPQNAVEQHLTLLWQYLLSVPSVNSEEKKESIHCIMYKCSKKLHISFPFSLCPCCVTCMITYIYLPYRFLIKQKLTVSYLLKLLL